MIIELTILNDDGTPMIMKDASASLSIYDHKTGDELNFRGAIVANKINYYYEMPKDKK